MIFCHYNNKNISLPQQFRNIRDDKLLTSHMLNEYFTCKDNLNLIFNTYDTDFIAETLINEISVIIESIAPSKRIQCSSNYAPWLNQEFSYQSKLRDRLHVIARNSNNIEDWRIYRKQRNKVNNLNKTNKSNYYNHNLNIKKGDLPGDIKFDSVYSDRKMWGTVKDLTNSSKQVPPRSLSVDGHMVTSLKKL